MAGSMRTTRAAAKAAASGADSLACSTATAPDVDNNASSLGPGGKREPLRSITPNSADGGEAETAAVAEEVEVAGGVKKGKGKKKRGKKGKRGPGKVDGEAADAVEGERVGEEEKSNETTKAPGLDAEPTDEISPKDISEPAAESSTPCNETGNAEIKPEGKNSEHLTVEGQSDTDDEVTAVKEVTKLIQQLPSPSNSSERSPASPVAPSSMQDSTSLKPESKYTLSPSTTLAGAEDPIDAIDALEDALEEIEGQIPPSPEKQKTKKPSPSQRNKPSPTCAPSSSKPPAKKSTSKTPSTKDTIRPSVSQDLSARNKTASTGARHNATSSSALGRSSSLRNTTKSSASRSSTTGRKLGNAISSPTATGNKGASNSEAKPSDYLASRRRPVSVHFPTPVPPPKSIKQPTRPIFALPGEAYQAKLKAQREAKKRREEEEAKRREFKARPIPAGIRGGTASSLVRQTASSRARMSAVGIGEGAEMGKENGTARKPRPKSVMGPPTGAGASKRNSTIFAGKRTSMAGDTNGTSAAPAPRPRPSSMIHPSKRSSVVLGGTGASLNPSANCSRRPSTATTTVTNSAVVSRSASLSNRRPASSLLSTTQPSAAQAPSVASGKATVSAADVALQRAKAREIFNRDRVEKEARERERREKEDAARKARAAAAERSRALSREWKEKRERERVRKGGKVESSA